MNVTRTVAGGGACQAFGASALLRDSVCRTTGGISPALTLGCITCTVASEVRNVTAVATGPASAGIGITITLSGGSVTLNARNVIAKGTSSDVTAFAAAGSSATVNLTSSDYATTSTSGAGLKSITAAGTGGNQMAPPLFVGATDFHQQPGSPTIDAGTSDALVGTVDLDGAPRSQDSNPACPNAGVPDIGAYEALGVAAASCQQPAPSKCKKKKKKKAKKRAAVAKKKKKKGCKKGKKKRK